MQTQKFIAHSRLSLPAPKHPRELVYSYSMTLLELGSAAAVQEFLQSHSHAVVTFSAHWCGPCKASKPALQELAVKHAQANSIVKMGIVYESDLGEAIHQYNVRAFPTYSFFHNASEVGRVEGANLAKLEEMIAQYGGNQPASFTGQGATLGGSAPSPAEARAARLAKLEQQQQQQAQQQQPTESTSTPDKETKDTSMEEEETVAAATATDDNDVEMKDASATEMVDPTTKLDPELVKTLTESMGFSLIRAQKGLLYGNGGTVEGAVEWLMEHQDDDDIDEPIAKEPATEAAVQSYKCNDCGKVLSNLANLELHANKTGHSDFAESTEHVKPLTAEEKAAKIAQIKELLKHKRREREEAEKVDEIEREKQRRFMAKEMTKTREQLEMEQRKREAMLRKKEKEDFKKERARIRAELARDKAERAAQGGKLSSKLGVEGYHPDGIQYDLEEEGEQEQSSTPQKKKAKADVKKIDDYIEKVSSYKAGGDGGKCLKVLKAYVGNVVDNPDEEKFKTINMENKAFKTKVKPFVGAKSLLLAVGFAQPEGKTDALVLRDDADRQVLADTKAKLEAALVKYG